jgi:hypothetical protein
VGCVGAKYRIVRDVSQPKPDSKDRAAEDDVAAEFDELLTCRVLLLTYDYA